jgi:hypothetical protein
VDFVVEHGRCLLPIEVKLAETVRHSDAAHLRRFMAEHPEAKVGVVVYAGSTSDVWTSGSSRSRGR